MSQYQPALAYVLGWEDPKHEYAIVPDVGGDAIAGVNSAEWPDDYATIAALSQSQRPSAVAYFYQTNFWNPEKAGGIVDQDVANRVLDQSVNGGLTTGPRLLQRAANSVGATLTADGVLGPLTLEVVNQIDPERLLAAYRVARSNHYEQIAADNPCEARYLPEWLKRANA